jgi:hypothetical protein
LLQFQIKRIPFRKNKETLCEIGGDLLGNFGWIFTKKKVAKNSLANSFVIRQKDIEKTKYWEDRANMLP